MGFLLSAELAIPANETAEIIIADKRDIIFLIFSPFLNIKYDNYVLKYSCSQLRYCIKYIYIFFIYIVIITDKIDKKYIFKIC